MKIFKVFILLSVLLQLAAPGWAQPGQFSILTVRLTGDHNAEVSWNLSGPVKKLRVLRTASPVDHDKLDRCRYPVTEFAVPPDSRASFRDDNLAHRTTYYYWLEVWRPDGKKEFLTTELDTPDADLEPNLPELCIVVDKTFYYLEVRSAGRCVKRYPVALGADPYTRKVCQDNSSTPEGMYRICGKQFPAVYYKAYDIDYPTPEDKVRYNTAKSLGLLPPGRGIGGEIQIHGDVKKDEEIFSNWTRGCIAMRNTDLDELFSHPDLGVGTDVFVVGANFTMDDLLSVLKPWTEQDIILFKQALVAEKLYSGPVDGNFSEAFLSALGRYQYRHGLPFTCDLDRRTVEALTKATARRASRAN